MCDAGLVFTKPLSQITFADVKALQNNQTQESDILDYKTGLIDDDQLIRHVTAFANTRGGFIIFGVEETGRGGFPKAIPGIDQQGEDGADPSQQHLAKSQRQNARYSSR